MEDYFTPHDLLLTRKEAAELLKICCNTLDRLKIKRVHLRRRVFYRKATLEAYLSAHERQEEHHQEVKNG